MEALAVVDTVLLVAAATFAAGYLIKTAVLLKQRKRILRLEDEMLANHARIRHVTNSTFTDA